MAIGFLTKTIEDLERYTLAGFTSQEFCEMQSNQLVANQINSFWLNSSLSQNVKVAIVRKHLSLLIDEPDYASFNEEEGRPEDVLGMLRAYITVPGECSCKTISYTINANGNVVIPSSYTPVVPWWISMMLGDPPSEIAIIPQEHPNADYLIRMRKSISKALDDQNDPDPNLRWVYHLKKNFIPNTIPGFLCKSCQPTTIHPVAPNNYVELLVGETYKFGVAIDENNSFQLSVEGRYSNTERFLMGITSFQYLGVTPSVTANMFADQITPNPVKNKVALLIEKILIFNYILNSPQKAILRARGIQTKNGLPPGLAIGK